MTTDTALATEVPGRGLERPIASFRVSGEPGFDYITEERTFPFAIEVQNAVLMDLAASTQTDNQGQATIQVTSFFPEINFAPIAPVNVTAVVHQTEPAIVTITWEVTTTNIVIHLHTWKPDGTPAGGILVDWRCRCGGTPTVV